LVNATPDGWTITDPVWCSTTWTSLTDAQKTLAARLAAFTVFSLTGRQFGTVTATLRPCNAAQLMPLYQTYPVNILNPWGVEDSGSYPAAYIYQGVWHNAGCGGISCCGARCEIDLPPTLSIASVAIDSATLDPSAYRVDNGHLLVRTDGDCWPQCQDLDKNPAVGVENTFTITGVFGRTVPQEALDAAGLLACEIGKAIAGQPCRLPQRMQSLTRQGVSVQFPSPNTYLDRGLTGLNEVDQLVVQLNPGRLTRAPLVLSPDVSPTRRTTWP
jgi:hypothetical protein